MQKGAIFRVARTREELEKAYSLVYKEYLKRGYTEENPSQLRFSTYNTLPHTATFIAINYSADVVATATVIPDSFFGLPMDAIYLQELNQLRAQNKKMCEISMLASDNDFFKNGALVLPLKKLYFMLSFFKVILDYVKTIIELDYICVTINPKYDRIFELLLFEDIGRLKSYPEVNGAPAIAKCIDVRSIKEKFSKPGKEKLYKMFVLQRTDPRQFLDKKVFTSEDLLYFFDAVSRDKIDACESGRVPSQIEYPW